MTRVAVVYFAKPSKSVKMKALAQALVQGLSSQGAQVELFDGMKTKDTKLTGFHFIAVGCDVSSLFKGTVPAEVGTYLANGGIVSGKKSFAFVLSSALGTQTTLSKLMRAMEKEGMLLRYSEAFQQPKEAKQVGEKLKLD